MIRPNPAADLTIDLSFPIGNDMLPKAQLNVAGGQSLTPKVRDALAIHSLQAASSVLQFSTEPNNDSNDLDSSSC
jgi:hypothetical protein